MDHEAPTIEEGVAGRSTVPLDFGVWTDHCIPQDRSGWHPLVRQFYEHWLSIAPPGQLPGRQHIEPEQMVPMLSRMWMLDVHRDPLRFRYRLCGTALVRSLNREVTGQWLLEFDHSISHANDRQLDPAISTSFQRPARTSSLQIASIAVRNCCRHEPCSETVVRNNLF